MQKTNQVNSLRSETLSIEYKRLKDDYQEYLNDASIFIYIKIIFAIIFWMPLAFGMIFALLGRLSTYIQYQRFDTFVKFVTDFLNRNTRYLIISGPIGYVLSMLLVNSKKKYHDYEKFNLAFFHSMETCEYLNRYIVDNKKKHKIKALQNLDSTFNHIYEWEIGDFPVINNVFN
ncbi:hypothetical protein ACFL0D_04955, partial [Thermoproteota archaeon]